jgi:hypothetical protein
MGCFFKETDTSLSYKTSKTHIHVAKKKALLKSKALKVCKKGPAGGNACEALH